ncbi:MAG: hypothetical protein ACREU6_02220, partial [Steroidobacteraceae bacterium]
AYLVTVRHPLEVADSLSRSIRAYGGMPLEDGLGMWKGYMQRVEAFLGSTDALAVHLRYDDLLRDWRQVVVRIAKRLDVALDADTHAGEIDGFLKRDMRSQHADERLLTGMSIRGILRVDARRPQNASPLLVRS